MKTKELTDRLWEVEAKLQAIKMATLDDNPEFSSITHPAFNAINKAIESVEIAVYSLCKSTVS